MGHPAFVSGGAQTVVALKGPGENFTYELSPSGGYLSIPSRREPGHSS
jgi:hypothetical protein